METLTRLNREQGVTIVVVTHEADIAAYADRILTMRDGQIVSDERNPKHGRSGLAEPSAEAVSFPGASAHARRQRPRATTPSGPSG